MLLRRIIEHVRTQNWTAVGLDFIIVVVGVFMGIQVSNWNDARSERKLGDDYLSGFRDDLLADKAMLQAEIEAREKQLESARVVLEFYDGRELELNTFFEAYYSVLYALNTTPNRNTMNEVLNSGNLRLIRDDDIRSDLLDLYATYDAIAFDEAHIARDIDHYLYDTTFSSIPINIFGPWPDTLENRTAAETLLGNVTVENGFRLIVANLSLADEGFLEDLAAANLRVETLLEKLQAN